MEVFDKKYERINSYLRNRMTPEEQFSFEEEMKNDSALVDEVEKVRIEIDTMELLLEKDLRVQMESWSKGTQPKKASSSHKKGLSWWPIVIGLVFLLGGIYFLNQNEETEVLVPEKKIEEKLSPPSIPIAKEEDAPIESIEPKQKEPEKEEINRSRYLAAVESIYPSNKEIFSELRKNASQKDTLTLAVQFFTKSQYSSGIALLEEYRKRKGDIDLGRTEEVLAHAYFKKGNYGKAKALFQAILDESTFKDEPEWYLLLYEFALGNDPKENLKVLEKISKDDLHEYQEDAILLKSKFNF